MKKKCTRCKWHLNDYVNCTGYFPPELDHAEIVFLAEAFGRNEALRGVALVGDAGKKFDGLLEFTGLTRDEVIVMNSMRCYQPGNPTPTKAELDACFIHVLKDIQKIKPKLVVAMGGSALYQAVGLEGVETYVGKLVWSDKIKCKVFVVNHPAAIIYDKSKQARLERHFKLIPSMVRAELTEIKNYDYEFIDSADRFREVYKGMVGKVLYYDLETTGLDPYTEDITELQIATTSDIIYVVDGNLLPYIIDELKELFYNCPVVGQGFEFDAKFLAVKLGIFPRHWLFDTCLAEFVLTGLKDNDLSFLTSKYATESLGYDQEVYAIGGAHKMADNEKRRQYGATDVGVLFPIHRKQKRLLTKTRQIDLLENIVVPTNKVLTKMSVRGITYDLDHLWKMDTRYKKKAGRLLARVSGLEGIKAAESKFKRRFNPRSPQMVHWLLLDYYDLPVIKEVTKGPNKGNPTIGKVEMKKYAEDYNNPYCIAMQQYRSYQNIRNNFLSGAVPKLVDGIGHTKYSLHVASSGRPVSTNPNLLNIPREKDIKRVFIPRDGHVFVCADLRQIEVRVAAVIYNDSNLIEVCNSVGSDFHCMIAAKANGIPYDEFYSRYKNGDEDAAKKRQDGKALTFGVLYQEGAEALAYNLGTSKRKAQEFIDDYFRGFPELKKNIEKQKQFVVKNGYVDTYFGFRRWFKNHQVEDHEILRMAVNTPIQGTAWNLLELILIEVDRVLEERGLKSALVLQVYDSVIVEAVENEVEEVALLIKEVMENINKPYPELSRVKIEIDMEIGDNLGELVEYV